MKFFLHITMKEVSYLWLIPWLRLHQCSVLFYINPHSYPSCQAESLRYGRWTRELVFSGNLENQILRVGPHWIGAQ